MRWIVRRLSKAGPASDTSATPPLTGTVGDSSCTSSGNAETTPGASHSAGPASSARTMLVWAVSRPANHRTSGTRYRNCGS